MAWTNEQLQSRVYWLFGLVIFSLLLSGVTLWRHEKLRNWAATTNNAAVPDYVGGNLTSYLGDLAEKITHHIEQAPEQGHGHPDQHREPPPPPDW